MQINGLFESILAGTGLGGAGLLLWKKLFNHTSKTGAETDGVTAAVASAATGAGARRRDVNRALLLWRQQLQCAGQGRGRIGLVVNSDLDAE